MRWASEAAAIGALAAASFGLYERRALAQQEEPSHGRIEGDVTLVAGLGGAATPRGMRGAGDLRVRYLDTAGVVVTYEEGGLFDAATQPQRLLAAGLELRPLFLARWLRGYETRSAPLDLVVDSFGLELAAVFAQHPGGPFGSDMGVQAGVGLEVPLLGSASGPWVGVHGGVRWSDAALASGEVRDATDRAAFLALTLAWHQLVMTHVVDLGDRAPR
jgi:hypothetical protein